jgi:hypothetical protein
MIDIVLLQSNHDQTVIWTTPRRRNAGYGLDRSRWRGGARGRFLLSKGQGFKGEIGTMGHAASDLRRDYGLKGIAFLAFILAAVGVAFLMSAAPARSQAASAARYTGVASCAGSTCHSRMEGDGNVVRQDELKIWQEPSSPSGAHSRAYAVLGNARSRFIARNLGLRAIMRAC